MALATPVAQEASVVPTPTALTPTALATHQDKVVDTEVTTPQTPTAQAIPVPMTMTTITRATRRTIPPLASCWRRLVVPSRTKVW